jgi:nucleoside-diphosphate-sugar epimerase
MKIFLIGSNGFLGKHLYNHYHSLGYEVIKFSYRPDSEISWVSQVEGIFKKNNFDLIINAAACQEEGDECDALKRIIESNILFPASLASIALKKNPHTCLINFGSSWQIDGEGNNFPFNAYAASKSAAEQFYDHFSLSGLKVASLRLYDTYGPNDRRNKIINLIADALIQNHELQISPGMQMLDFVYIDDVISAVDFVSKELRASLDGIHLRYSVRSQTPVTILDTLKMMCTIVGYDNIERVVIGARRYRDRERFKLYEFSLPTPLGWQPQTSLIEGLTMLIEDRKANFLRGLKNVQN